MPPIAFRNELLSGGKELFYSEIMEKKREEKACVFNITGGSSQIMPNLTEMVQNFYVDGSGVAVMKEYGMVSVRKRVTVPDDMESSEKGTESLKLAEGELRIYYADDASLNAFIIRVGACKDAAELANLVVGDMMEHTIMNGNIAVKSHFIEALLVFVHFTKGSSVSNVRQQIRKSMVVSGAKKKGTDSIRGK